MVLSWADRRTFTQRSRRKAPGFATGVVAEPGVFIAERFLDEYGDFVVDYFLVGNRD
jgi:hypothetical protein